MDYQDDIYGDGFQINLDPSMAPTERWEDIQARAIREEKARAEAEALEHARAGGECLLLAASSRRENQWLPYYGGKAPGERALKANAAAQWVAENIPTAYGEGEPAFDAVARYCLGDTKGMSGGKRGLKADIASWLRQYEQGFVDPVNEQGEVIAEGYKPAPAPSNNPFAALKEMMA